MCIEESVRALEEAVALINARDNVPGVWRVTRTYDDGRITEVTVTVEFLTFELALRERGGI